MIKYATDVHSGERCLFATQAVLQGFVACNYGWLVLIRGVFVYGIKESIC